METTNTCEERSGESYDQLHEQLTDARLTL